MANPFAAAADRLKVQAAGTFYRGASYDRLNADWFGWRLSPDLQMRFDLQTLRNRARQLVGNNATAAAIPKIMSENVIGKDGIVLQARIENSRGKMNNAVNQKIEDAWQAWCEYGNPSCDGQGGFVDLQKLWLQAVITDGETLLYHVEGYRNKWGYAIDTLDADQLDHMHNLTGSSIPPQTNSVRLGVEVDMWNRPVAYWLWSTHPTNPEGKIRERITADRVDHVYYEQVRPKATRGITWFAPILFDLNMLGGYRDAAITAARVAASTMGFFTQNEDAIGPLSNPKGNKDAVPMWSEPGMLRQLPPGMDIKSWAPNHPSTSFKEFDESVTRTISTGSRVSYMTLSNDLSSTSFSSGRIGVDNEREVFKSLQQWMIRRILTRVYRRWVRMAMVSGALKLPSMDPSDYYNVSWHARSYTYVDPQKDIDVLERQVAMGINSLTRACADQGRDIEEVLKERAQEIALAEKYNVPLVISAGRAKPINVDTTQEAEEDKTGDTPDAEQQQDALPPGQPSQQRRLPSPANRNGNGSGRLNHIVVEDLFNGQ